MTKAVQPLFPEVGIIGLVYHKWDSRWLTPHHVLTRLGQYFRVVWVSPAHEWHEIPKRLHGAPDGQLDAIDIPGFQIYTPEWWLPKLHRFRAIADFTFDQRVRNARRLLAKQGCKKIVLYLWNHQFERALSVLPYDVSGYHIDDEYSFSTIEQPTDPAELRVISAVDEVFAISPALLEKKGKINPHTTFAPEGVDYSAYATPVPPPDDIASIPRPRIGYSGFLKKQLDWALLLELATRHPEWSFVFVGASKHAEIQEAVGRLSRLPNVHFLGSKSTQELACYPQHFDVCTMPYCLDDYTKYIYPLKLHEYLASGRPVVGVPIRSLQEFTHVVKLATSADDWSKAIAASLEAESGGPEQVRARRKVAYQYDWGSLIRSIARTFCNRLGPSYVERLDSIPVEIPYDR
jgi:glycosyltransferase involved in cell wall biosynthesis